VVAVKKAVTLTDHEWDMLTYVARNRPEARAMVHMRHPDGSQAFSIFPPFAVDTRWEITDVDCAALFDRLCSLGLIEAKVWPGVHGDLWEDKHWEVTQKGLTHIHAVLGKDGPYLVSVISYSSGGTPGSLKETDAITGQGLGEATLYCWSDGLVTWKNERPKDL